MKKDVKLYNLIMPTFMLLTLHPLMWILSLTGNFIIDSIVLILVSLIVFKKLDGQFYKKNIIKVWLLGFLADFIGAGYLLLLDKIGYEYIMMFEEQSNSFIYNIMTDMHLVTFPQDLATVGSRCFLASGILLAAVMIFVFDYAVFKNYATFESQTEISKKQIVISALMFAVLTAPYTYFIPEESFDWYFDLFSLIGF